MDDENISSANILGGYQNVVGSYRGEDYYTYSKDIQGSTSSITDGNFNAKAIYEYSAFGEVEEVVETIDNEICYTGAIHDETTGLHYMNARYYDPTNGRFISQDSYRGSVGDIGQWHLYVYCANNPINYVDPSGHKRIKIYISKDYLAAILSGLAGFSLTGMAVEILLLAGVSVGIGGGLALALVTSILAQAVVGKKIKKDIYINKNVKWIPFNIKLWLC